MGRASSPPRTEPGSTPEPPTDALERESFEFAVKVGSFADAESSGNSSAIAKMAPQIFSTDTHPPRIQWMGIIRTQNEMIRARTWLPGNGGREWHRAIVY